MAGHEGSLRVARTMDTARLFQSGRSQAVRLPKAYRCSGTEVIEDPWQTLEAGLAAFEPDFQISREQPEQPEQPEQQQRQELAP